MTVKLYFRVILEYLVSFAVIVGCLQLGLALQNLSGLPVPGTIFGMLILFGLLASKVIPARWVEPSATLLTRNMIFLFIPVSVGLMNHLQVIADYWLTLLVSVFVSSLIVLVLMSWGINKLSKGKA
jgi:holin-like protein